MLRAPLVALALLAAPSLAAAQTTDMNAMARESAQRLLGRAQGAEREGRPLDAEALYLRAVEVDGAVVDAWLGASRLLASRGRGDEARRLLARVPRRALVDDDARVALARALRGLGDDDGALAVLRQGAPTVALLRARVSLCAETGRFPEALAVARRWAELAATAEGDAREARVTEHALRRLVAEADAVSFAPDASPLRRLLGAR